MFIKQVSVFSENKSGRIAEIIGILGDNGIDISALSVADTTDFGIVRMIVSDYKKAEQVLRESGAVVKVTDVLGVGVADVPGGLAAALCVLKEAAIEIDYIYAFVGKSDKGALVVMKVNDPEKAEKVFEKNGIDTLAPEDVYRV